MKEKTKKMLIISGSAALCAALVCVISAQFAKDEQPTETASLPQQNTPAVTVAISTTAKPETEPIVMEETEEIYTAESPAETLELPGNVQEIDQSFSEPELPELEPPVPVIPTRRHSQILTSRRNTSLRILLRQIQPHRTIHPSMATSRTE